MARAEDGAGRPRAMRSLAALLIVAGLLAGAITAVRGLAGSGGTPVEIALIVAFVVVLLAARWVGTLRADHRRRWNDPASRIENVGQAGGLACVLLFVLVTWLGRAVAHPAFWIAAAAVVAAPGVAVGWWTLRRVPSPRTGSGWTGSPSG